MKRWGWLLLAALPALGQGADIQVSSASSTADPLSLANIAGTTSVCSVGPPGTANGVCLESGQIIGEGSGADAFETFLAFGNATADQTLTCTGAASSLGCVVAAPAQAASTVAGNALAFTASAATAGSTNAGAADGGGMTFTSGAAAQKTSGNANGGNFTFVAGAGVGTGTAGQVVVPAGVAAAPGLTGNDTDTGIYFPAANAMTLGVGAATNSLALSTTTTTSAQLVLAPRYNATEASDLGFAVTNAAGGIAFYKANQTGQIKWAGSSDGVFVVGLARIADGVLKVTNASTGGGDLVIGTGILTAATATAETTAKVKDVISSYTWANAQVAALAGTAGDIDMVTLPAKTQVLGALVVITGQAAGPTTVTVSCGDATVGTPFTNYILPSDAKAAVNTVYGDAINGSETGASLFDATVKWVPVFLPSYTAATLVTCHFISTGADLSTTTGSTGRLILTTRLLP